MRDNREIFKENDLKFTKQRDIIYSILRNSKNYQTAEEILTKSKLIDDKISFSTVYRNLNIFIEKGLVVKFNLLENENFVYEATNKIDHIHYIKCINCNKKIEIKSCPIKVFEESIIENTGFEIIDHKFEIYGYCPKCKNKTTS